MCSMMPAGGSTGGWRIINYLSYFGLESLPAASPLGRCVILIPRHAEVHRPRFVVGQRRAAAAH